MFWGTTRLFRKHWTSAVEPRDLWPWNLRLLGDFGISRAYGIMGTLTQTWNLGTCLACIPDSFGLDHGTLGLEFQGSSELWRPQKLPLEALEPSGLEITSTSALEHQDYWLRILASSG
ncbi:hypothetical protein Tco_0883954 [Tanacetum coccineum]